MSATKDRLILDLNDTIERAEEYSKGEYTFIHEHVLEFTFDVTEAFEKEPGLFKDSEIKELMKKAVEAMKPYVRELAAQSFDALNMTFLAARAAFNYNPDYYWLWLPEKIMTDEQHRKWNKYMKTNGYTV